ncbi:MAG: ChbG/HpnK family deacetylase [Saprospiraceae bacterium]
MAPTKFFSTISFFFLLSILNINAQKSLAEKLGYDADAKLLIIHADDLGVAHSENKASFLAMKIGMVNSASIMMPCPWVPEVADFAKENPTADLGLHLTLTSEWKHIKWGPVAPKGEVKSLLNDLGFFTTIIPILGKIYLSWKKAN